MLSETVPFTQKRETRKSEFAAKPQAILVHDPVTAGAFDELEHVGDSPDLESKYLFRYLPQKHRYFAQHAAMIALLRRHVAHVFYLEQLVGDETSYEATATNPNQVFTRDSLITIPWLPDAYFKARMRPELRRRESLTMEAAAKRLGLREIVKIPDGLFLEGGDVIPFVREGKRTLLVGYGPRSTLEAIDFLQQHLIPTWIDEIVAIELAKYRMNLDGGLVPVADDVIISNTSSVVRATLLDSRSRHEINIWDMFRDLDMQVIETTREESVYCQSCNCVCLGERKVIYYDLCPRVAELLKRHGVVAHLVAGSELVKGRGGPRCMTRPIYRGIDGMPGLLDSLGRAA